MERKHKILVVEDDTFIIDNMYKEYLAPLNLDIDYAQSKREAIEKVRCKTYDVAFVDIMLREDQKDRGGVEVIEYLHELNEGTAIIVVSATDDIKVALKTYRTGIVDFIQKENVHTKKDILTPLDKILSNRKLYQINHFGKFISLSAYLAAPELTPYWEHKIQNTLGIGYQMMIDTFNSALGSCLPIPRRKDATFSLSTDSDTKSVSGIFWSKGTGVPIWFGVANKSGKISEPPSKSKGELLKNYKKGDLLFSIWKLINTKRDDFNDHIWDDIK